MHSSKIISHLYKLLIINSGNSLGNDSQYPYLEFNLILVLQIKVFVESSRIYIVQE